MARTCTVCAHEDRPAIDAAIAERRPYRDVARRFEVSKDAVGRHAEAHLSPAMARLQRAREERGAESAHARLEELYSVARGLLAASVRDGRPNISLQAVRELRGVVELLAKLSGELDERPTTTVNLLVSGEWQQVRAAIFDALGPHPDARVAVAARLGELEAGG